MFFIKYLAALAYDAMILVVLFFTITALVLVFHHGRAIPPSTLWYQCLLIGTALVYYQTSIRWGGQTLGMRAWRIKLTTLEKNRPTNRQILLRILYFLPAALAAIFSLNAHYTFLNQWTQTTFIKL